MARIVTFHEPSALSTALQGYRSPLLDVARNIRVGTGLENVFGDLGARSQVQDTLKKIRAISGTEEAMRNFRGLSGGELHRTIRGSTDLQRSLRAVTISPEFHRSLKAVTISPELQETIRSLAVETAPIRGISTKAIRDALDGLQVAAVRESSDVVASSTLAVAAEVEAVIPEDIEADAASWLSHLPSVAQLNLLVLALVALDLCRRYWTHASDIEVPGEVEDGIEALVGMALLLIAFIKHRQD